MTPPPPSAEKPPAKRVLTLSLATLGIVYGDIGTSPLYAVRECFVDIYGFPITPANVLGILSMIAWSLFLIISVKYLLLVLRADNKGEGGILALTHLVIGDDDKQWTRRTWTLIGVGLFGAALLYGDGIITPALSVLSAIEGLEVATPAFQPYILPITVAILFLLFALQSRGTMAVSFLFGPIAMLWFVVLAVLGLHQIIHLPEVLKALHPGYALAFFQEHGFHGMLILGAVFLVVTGGEALYADLGHFGRRPIQISWFSIVLPSLLLNYFGQGALLLQNPAAVSNPFYYLAPSWALYPLVCLATVATIIASQAVISGVFSLASQSVHMGYLPQMEIRHTSGEKRGQIYVPLANWLMLLGAVWLVVGFRSSTGLAGAYGIAVSATMTITTILLFRVMVARWKWPWLVAVPITAAILSIDLTFFSRVIGKLPYGGWVPVLIALVVFTIMMTWRKGLQLLRDIREEQSLNWDDFFDLMKRLEPQRPEGTAVYLVERLDRVPPALGFNIRTNHVVHEQILLIHIERCSHARMPKTERLDIKPLRDGIIRITACYGFMEAVDIPQLLEQVDIEDNGIHVDPANATYILSRERIIPNARHGMAHWRETLFGFLFRNAQQRTKYFHLPARQVIEIDNQLEF